jgi:hypothetical protein
VIHHFDTEQDIKKFKKLKVHHLYQLSKYYNEHSKVWVEQWSGETEELYFLIELAYSQAGTLVVGAIGEREMLLHHDRKILFDAAAQLSIQDIIKKYKWDISKASIAEFAILDEE